MTDTSLQQQEKKTLWQQFRDLSVRDWTIFVIGNVLGCVSMFCMLDLIVGIL